MYTPIKQSSVINRAGWHASGSNFPLSDCSRDTRLHREEFPRESTHFDTCTTIKPLSFRCPVLRTSKFSPFGTDTTNLRWTKAIGQAQTIKTFPLWGEGQWQAMGKITKRHCFMHAYVKLGCRQPGIGRLTVCLRTQYPCGYNYNHCTKAPFCTVVSYCP